MRRQELRGGLDTDVVSSLTGGLQVGYSINEARHLNRRTSQISLLASFQWSFVTRGTIARRSRDGGFRVDCKLIHARSLRLPALLALRRLSRLSRHDPPPREFDGASAFRYIETQVGFGPRIPGTEAHQRMAAWLDSLLRARADTRDHAELDPRHRQG